MEYVVKEEARKVAERELKKAKQLRQAQVRQQTIIWTEETRKRFEIEKERQIQLLASALTAQAQANVMARIEQINIEHDLAMAQVGAAQRAAAELRDSQKVKELKRLKNIEIAKQRGTSALKNHRSKVEMQKEDNLTVLQRKQQVRQTEDLKAKDLVERKPFKSSNIPPVSSREKKHGPPEYQQSKAKTLRIAPSYQGQENNNGKSPKKAAVKGSSPHKNRLKPKQDKKLKDQDKDKKPQLRPPIGIFSKEVERRQSGLRASSSSKKDVQPIEKDRPKKVMDKSVKPKIKPVVFYDASIPKSEIKYMPPPGLAERVEKEKGTLDAWEGAEQLSKVSVQSERNEENLNQQREMLAKYRGEKALELERLSRELTQLTEELVKNSDGIKIPKYSLASAQLGLEDVEEEPREKSNDKHVIAPLPKPTESVTEDSRRKSLIHESFESHCDSKSSSGSSETDFYSPSSRESSNSCVTPDEIKILKSKLSRALEEDFDEAEVDSCLIPTKICKPEDVSSDENKKSPIISDLTKELKSLPKQQTQSSSSSPTEFLRPSHNESSRSTVHSSNESLKSKKSDNNDHRQTTPRKLVDVLVAEKPSDHIMTPKSVKATVENITRKSLSAPIQKSKESSGSTTEYYSPPHTSTPDGSKTRISGTSSTFKYPLGPKESKALRRYVTKMLHMKRESIDRLSESSSCSDNSKVLADSFQSEMSSCVNSPNASPSSVSSKTDCSHGSPIFPGSRYLQSLTEEEDSEVSHPTSDCNQSSSPSTIANVSLKIRPLSRNTSESRTSSDGTTGTSFKSNTGTPLARNGISDTSLADKLEALSEHQIKSIAQHGLMSSSNDISIDNRYISPLSNSSKNSKTNGSKSSLHQVSSDEGTLPDLSPFLKRMKAVTSQQSSSSKNLEQQKDSTSTRPESGGSSDKEVLRGLNDGNWRSTRSPQSTQLSPVYNVTDHAELLSSIFGELRNQWANISIERPPWCS